MEAMGRSSMHSLVNDFAFANAQSKGMARVGKPAMGCNRVLQLGLYM